MDLANAVQNVVQLSKTRQPCKISTPARRSLATIFSSLGELDRMVRFQARRPFHRVHHFDGGGSLENGRANLERLTKPSFDEAPDDEGCG
jgi:hypothetical protein